MTTTDKDNTKMTDEEALDRIFADYRPKLSPAADFMESLQRKMEIADYVRRTHRARIHRYRMAVVASFVLGSVAGALIIVLMPDLGPALTTPLLQRLSPTQLAVVELLHLQQALLPALCTLVGMGVIALSGRQTWRY